METTSCFDERVDVKPDVIKLEIKEEIFGAISDAIQEAQLEKSTSGSPSVKQEITSFESERVKSEFIEDNEDYHVDEKPCILALEAAAISDAFQEAQLEKSTSRSPSVKQEITSFESERVLKSEFIEDNEDYHVDKKPCILALEAAVEDYKIKTELSTGDVSSHCHEVEILKKEEDITGVSLLTSDKEDTPELSPEDGKIKKERFIQEGSEDEDACRIISCPDIHPEPAICKIHSVDHLNKSQFHEDVGKKSMLPGNKFDIHTPNKGAGPRKQLCDQCGKTFPSKNHLAKHVKIHVKVKQFKCDLCGKTFADRSRVSKHMKTHIENHLASHPYHCKICGNFFAGASYFRIHMRIHSGEKPFKCDVCSESFVANHFLTIHKRKHTGERPYTCEECGKTFRTCSYFNMHRRSHLEHLKVVKTEPPSEQKLHNCEECGKDFKRKLYLKRHKQRFHSGPRCFPCDECPRTFTYKYLLDLHKAKHLEEKPFKCDQCDRSFTGINYLNSHKRSMHLRHLEKPYTCDECGKSFTSTKCLKMHMKLHSTKEQFKCEICGKGFTVKHYFNLHMKAHVQGNLYKCEHCAAKFATKPEIKEHLRKHIGYVFEKCDVCFKIFTQGGLNKHRRLHYMEMLELG